MLPLDHDRLLPGRAADADRRFDGWFVTAVAHDRHLLPPELPGRDAQAPATSTSSRRRRPPSSAASGPASGAGPTPRRARRTGTSAATSSPGRCASSPTASSTARASPGLARRLAYSERHLNRADDRRARRRPARHRPGPAGPHGPHAARDDRHRPPGRRVRRRLRQRPPVQRHRPRGVRDDAVGAAAAADARPAPAPAGAVELDLAGARAVRRRPTCWRSSPPAPCPGVEPGTARRYHRALDLPRGHGVAVLAPAGAVDRRPAPRARPPAARRLARPRRRPCGASGALLDLDADPVAVDDALAPRTGARRVGRRHARAARARQRRPVRDGRARPSSASRSPSPAPAP